MTGTASVRLDGHALTNELAPDAIGRVWIEPRTGRARVRVLSRRPQSERGCIERGTDIVATLHADRRSQFGRRTRQLIAVIGVLEVVVAGIWWVSRSSSPPGDPRLYDSAWQLESASIGGRPVDVGSSPAPVRWQFTIFMCDGDPTCSDTPAVVGGDGCRSFYRELDLDDSSGRRAPSSGGDDPQHECESEIFDEIVAFFGPGRCTPARCTPTPFTYTFDDDRLRLAAAGDASVLTFRSIPHWRPSED